MAYITTYQDLFPGSTIMRQAPGNGTITVPGAGDARLIAPNGANCQFYAGDGSGRAPILYERLSTMWQSAQPAQPLFVEAKLSSFTGTTNLRIAGLSIFTALPGTGVPFYSYQMGWYKNDGKIHIWYDYPYTEADFGSWTVADPATTPQIYRIHWNPYNRPMYIPELGGMLPPDYINFSYSVDNGVTWVSIYSRARDFDFGQACAGLYVRKWETSAVSAQGDFAYFRASQYDAADQLYVPKIGKGNQDSVGLEDQLSLLTQSGPERFDLSGVGSAKAITPPTAVGFEDQGYLLNLSGKPRFDLPEISEAVSLPSVGMAFEEGLFVQLDNTDYIKQKYDADGREYLGNYSVRHILYYDATLDPWHAHGAGFYGFARNGKAYYDGVECGPGAFSVGGTPALNRTAWSGPDGYLDSSGVANAAAVSYPVAGTIRVAANSQYTVFKSVNRWFFTGDFDIQADYNIVSNGSGPSDGGIFIEAYLDPNNYWYVRRRMFGGAVYDKDVKNNGGWGNYASVATAHTSGKMRLVRSGNTVRSYYWTGSAWAQIGSDSTLTNGTGRPMWVNVGHWVSVTPTGMTYEFSAWQINSGTTTNLAGWAREAAGTYRGSLAEFPQHALIVSSGNSLDIIDVDTNKLWMSFRGGATKLIGGDSNFYVPQVAFKDGTLLLCYRTTDTYGSSDGYGYWIDFTLDFARCHRGPTYNDAGFYYNVELTTGVWPRDSANGCIAWRNSNRGETGSHFDNWQFQNSRANWGDLLHYGGFQYRLIANNGGVYLSRWTRWKYEGTSGTADNLNTLEYGVGTQTVATRWAIFRPTSRDILAHNRVKLWITHYATWNVVLGGGGGTWLEDHEYTLAGVVDPLADGALAQDSMALDDAASLLFYARNEGVYVMDLTTGTSTLIYGKAGSGATHEVLGDYATISSVKLAMDGAASLIIIGMARPDRIWAVNRATHTVYWRGFQDDAHQPLSMAVGA